MERIQDLHARTVSISIEIVSKITLSDVGRSTPCTGWVVEDLVAHMVAHHRGFAAAARGVVTTAEEWESTPLIHLLAEYAGVAREVMAAFAEDGVLDRNWLIPVISATRRFPGRASIGFHLIDYVVHSWDVARAIGVSVDFDRDVLAEAMLLALEVPDDARRLAPDSMFAPAVAVPPPASHLDRIVAILGRSPSWPDPPCRRRRSSHLAPA